MKIAKSLISIILLVSLLSGCSLLTEDVTKKEVPEKVFTIEKYNVSITVPSTFEKITEETEWDIQLSDNNIYLSTMVYNYEEIPESTSKDEVFEIQNQKILSERSNVETIIPETSYYYDDKKIYHTRLSAVSEVGKNYYDSFLVDMYDDEMIAWVLVTGTPEVIEQQTEQIKNYVKSLKHKD